MIALRPYQTEAIAAVAAGYRRGVRRPLIGLPTGTGKTVVFSTIAKGAAAKGRRVLILAHRDELIQQAAKKVIEVAPELQMCLGVVKASQDEHDRDVVVASVQTLARQSRLDRLGRFDLVIVDEAHHAAASSYRRILAELGSEEPDGPLTIGVTATPQRADRLDLGAVWQEIVYHRDMLSMMREGYLCDLRGVRVKLAALDLSRVRTTGGDYNDGDLEVALDAADAPEHGVRAWHKYCAGRKTICFTPTIALAESVAAEFRKTGVKAVSLSGNTPRDERREMLAAFGRGDITVIANAQVLTEGYDEPTVECIMIARPTKSQPMYVQMVGRGTRLSPGKKDCIVLDIVGATERLDLITLPKLFGLGDDEPAGDADEVDAETGAEDDGSMLDRAEAQLERERRAGRITARQVELFSRTDLNWIAAEPGLWVLSGGRETIHLRARAKGWDVITRRRDDTTGRVLAADLDLGYAMGVAEDHARTSSEFVSTFISKSAAYRGKPATDKQRAALRRFKIKPAADLSSGEASDLLAAAIARIQRERV